MSQTSSASFNVAANTAPSVSDPHALQANDVMNGLGSRRDGLSAAEAADRLKAVGPNRLPAPPKEGLLKRFFKHFNDILIYILLFAGVAKAVLGHWVDACVILAVAVINAIVGFLQEGRLNKLWKASARCSHSVPIPGARPRGSSSTPRNLCPATSCGFVPATVSQPTSGSSRRLICGSKSLL